MRLSQVVGMQMGPQTARLHTQGLFHSFMMDKSTMLVGLVGHGGKALSLRSIP